MATEFAIYISRRHLPPCGFPKSSSRCPRTTGLLQLDVEQEPFTSLVVLVEWSVERMLSDLSSAVDFSTAIDDGLV